LNGINWAASRSSLTNVMIGNGSVDGSRHRYQKAVRAGRRQLAVDAAELNQSLDAQMMS
jgi:hypothetical protein